MGKKYTALALALVFCLAIALPATASGAISYVKLPASWTALNVRAGAGTNYAVVTWVVDGDKIEVVQKGATWSKITVAQNGKTGYIRNTYIENLPDDTTKPSADGTFLAGSVSGKGVNMRTGPGTGYAKVTSFTKGTKVRIWEESGNWYYVTAPSGEKGWMSKTYISLGYTMATTADVNFRKSPNGAIIKTLEKGKDVEIISVTGSWSKVKVGSATGYVFSKYLK